MSTPSTLKSVTFVVVQFLSLGLILLTGPILPANLLLLGLEIAGLGLGLWAVFAAGIGNFNVTPEPVRGGQFFRGGPYRLIRHPMYLALLLTTLPLVIAEFSVLRGLVWIVLLVDLVLKLNYEEGLLAAELEGYREYMQGTYRLIPFVY